MTKGNELYHYKCSKGENEIDSDLINLIDKLDIGEGTLKGFDKCHE